MACAVSLPASQACLCCATFSADPWSTVAAGSPQVRSLACWQHSACAALAARAQQPPPMDIGLGRQARSVGKWGAAGLGSMTADTAILRNRACHAQAQRPAPARRARPEPQQPPAVDLGLGEQARAIQAQALAQALALGGAGGGTLAGAAAALLGVDGAALLRLVAANQAHIQQQARILLGSKALNAMSLGVCSSQTLHRGSTRSAGSMPSALPQLRGCACLWAMYV